MGNLNVFLYIYADILTFYQPGNIEKIIAGEIGGIQINQAFLLTTAMLMAIPSVMVFLSLTLKAKANRWTNIIIGIFHAVLLLATNALVAGEIWGFHMVAASAEAVLIALILWYAWKWK
jgi:hypothetical protein